MVHSPGVEGCTHYHAESTVIEQPLPLEEFVMQLEVTMADQPGQPCPPPFLWNAGMVLHVLKNDLALRELEHIQVDGPGMHICSSMTDMGTQPHVESCPVSTLSLGGHIFRVDRACPHTLRLLPLLLDEGCHHAAAAQDRH